MSTVSGSCSQVDIIARLSGEGVHWAGRSRAEVLSECCPGARLPGGRDASAMMLGGMFNAALLPDLLDASREFMLARRIEAGLVADHALAHPWPTDASQEELRRIRREGRQAWHEFRAANLRLAAMLARSAAHRTGMEFDDLLQESAVALAHALQRFDSSRGRFSTYAFPVIRRHLMRVTSSLGGQLGLPPSRAVAMRRAQGLVQELAQDLARTPELAEISEILGRDRAWTARLLRHRVPASLEELAQLPPDPLSPYDRWEDDLIHDRLRREIARLPGDQRQVIELRFGIADGRCHSYREIAARHELSSSSIRRIEQRGLAALRHRELFASVPGTAVG
ncbi:MAG: sigma-70 family RNA polymerase sigma factor [Propionibacteriaceae bacterium]|nr:sigma-70 family RNA polymerase sigma factor [Propionibacteriaceae bacterium]